MSTVRSPLRQRQWLRLHNEPKAGRPGHVLERLLRLLAGRRLQRLRRDRPRIGRPDHRGGLLGPGGRLPWGASRKHHKRRPATIVGKSPPFNRLPEWGFPRRFCDQAAWNRANLGESRMSGRPLGRFKKETPAIAPLARRLLVANSSSPARWSTLHFRPTNYGKMPNHATRRLPR